MYRKVLFATILVVFVCIQLGVTLDCYACDTYESCKSDGKLRKITCDEGNANETVRAISQFYYTAPNKPSSNFTCLTMNLTEGVNRDPIFNRRGCVFVETASCFLVVNTAVSLPYSTECRTCNIDLCNGNPAGSFSSSVFTMIASVVGVTLAKRFIF